MLVQLPEVLHDSHATHALGSLHHGLCHLCLTLYSYLLPPSHCEPLSQRSASSGQAFPRQTACRLQLVLGEKAKGRGWVAAPIPSQYLLCDPGPPHGLLCVVLFPTEQGGSEHSAVGGFKPSCHPVYQGSSAAEQSLEFEFDLHTPCRSASQKSMVVEPLPCAQTPQLGAPLPPDGGLLTSEVIPKPRLL